jgi:phosphatidylglycerophosphate synthase
MIEEHYRAVLQPSIDRICRHLPSALTADHLTLCALVVGLAAGCALAYGHLIVGCILIWISGLCDVLDGTHARLTRTMHPKGAYKDLIADRIVESAIILGFAVRYPEHHMAYLLFVICVLLHFSTFLAAAALMPNLGNKSVHYEHTLIERCEAFIGFSLLCLFPQQIGSILTVLNLLIVYTAATRFIRVMHMQQQEPDEKTV